MTTKIKYQPAFKWTGGKNRMLDSYENIFFPDKVDTFVDLFGGACSVSMWVRTRYPEATIYLNDYNSELILVREYNEDDYPKYDNYDAINVDKVKDIPVDYDGVIGVPITFLNVYNPKQFEIVKFRKGNDDKDLSVNGKCPYFRILIRRK